MSSPTVRSLKHLRDLGFKAFVVERYISFTHRRIDFGNFSDILAYRGGIPGVLAVQTTTASNVAAHKKKYQAPEILNNLTPWFKAGNQFEIHGWSKKGAKGKRKIWKLTIHHIYNKEELLNVENNTGNTVATGIDYSNNSSRTYRDFVQGI